jgi:methylisocitrate lyase
LLSFPELAELGYKMVIFPQSMFRVAMKAGEEFLRALKKSGSQKEWIDEMQTREELYDLLDYDPAVDRWVGLRET